MRLFFHGGAREVGRSCIEVKSDDARVLLDAGLKLGKYGTEYPLHLDDLQNIDAVLISHAHLDHTGALPVLHHNGLDCPVFATDCTKDLMRLLLKDALHIGKIRHEHLDYSLKDINDILRCMKLVKRKDKGTIKGMGFQFFNAGHIPGSTTILIDAEGKRLLYTGDINTIETRLLDKANLDVGRVDILITETTYGDRSHPPRAKEERRFIKAIKDTIDDGGSVIIPVFAVGRAQEVILILAEHDFGVPVFLDGMSVDALRIILSNPQSLKNPSSLKKAMKRVTLINMVNERIRAIHNNRRAIFITTSGMLTGGPVITYLQQLAHNHSNSILLTGYQGEDTNGRMLLNEHALFLDGKRTNVAAKVDQFDFSAHSGLVELKQLIKRIKPGKLILQHGDELAASELELWAKALDYDVSVPKIGDVIDL